ncbi:hypothetical protein M9H77_32430 [Catharanthus roseus]|uniref:Uncharacterized protein n=1 Tax=Catharanthus roseus TaxID=4058 RepID=A0ACC0A2Y5_CATRO|nr:hypothetical protein M9H77_32430 [Catharanthus roseus]
MVRPSGRRGDDDLGPVTDKTSRVEGRTVKASSRGEAGYSTQPPAVPFRSRPPLQPHMSHTPVPYEPYGSVHPPSHPTDTVYDPYLHVPTVMRPRLLYRSATQEPILEFRGQPRQIGVEFFYQMLGAAPQDSSCSTHEYSHAVYGVSSSDPYVPGPIAASRNKRPEVARDVPAATQKRKKVKASNWEQIGAAKGGPVDPELIPLYSGHVAGPIWRGRIFIFMLKGHKK